MTGRTRPCGVQEYYLHAALLIEPFSPCTFQFTFGELSQDVQVDFTKAQTLKDIVDGARSVPDGSIFSGPRIAAALESGAADEAPWSLRFELKDVPSSKAAVSTFRQDEFLSLTPEGIAVLFEDPTDPISIVVTVEKRELEEEVPTKSDA
jgi:hypothetical protein